MTIDLYYSLRSPPSRSVLLVAKALGVELNLKQLSGTEYKTPEFLKINPQHCVPTLVDNGFNLCESRAILGYLVNQYGKDDSLYPKDPKKRALVDQRLYFDIGTLFPRLREFFLALKNGLTPDADTVTKVDEAFELLNKFLEEQDWLAGSNITIADFAIVVNVSLIEVLELDISKYQNLTRWFSKVKETIVGYSEVQDTGNALLKEMIGAQASSQK